MQPCQWTVSLVETCFYLGAFLPDKGHKPTDSRWHACRDQRCSLLHQTPHTSHSLTLCWTVPQWISQFIRLCSGTFNWVQCLMERKVLTNPWTAAVRSTSKCIGRSGWYKALNRGVTSSLISLFKMVIPPAETCHSSGPINVWLISRPEKLLVAELFRGRPTSG